MKVDHIGYAVKNIEKAKKTMELLGYTFEDVIQDSDRQIDICFGELDGYRVELIAPNHKDSPVDAYLKKIGSTPYHLCYQSDCIEQDIQRLVKNHFRISIPLAPAVAFEGRRVVFMYSLSIGLIEIVEM